MTIKTWNFALHGQLHTLILEHGIFSRKRAIVLDGQLLEHIPRNLIDFGSRHEYHMGSHSLVVVIRWKFVGFAYDLLVDGVSLTTGASEPRRVMNPALKRALALAVTVLCSGLVVSWYAKLLHDKQLAIQEWPIVTGKVTGLDTSRHTESNEYGPDSEHYHPILEVEFVANDSRQTVRLEQNNHAYDTSGQALAVHSVGESQRLYVNPAKPQEAVLYFERLDLNGWTGTARLIMEIAGGLAVIILVVGWLQSRT